jgi:FkbM family methyltransferase
MKIIYDIGSNNGDDITYYLMKADLVVAVEANPVLTDHIKTRFATAIADGKLIVENIVVDVKDSTDSVPFYVHASNHTLSQFVQPAYMGPFVEIQVPSKNIVSLIQEHGDPYYIKIDIEHFDQAILRAIFEGGIFPPYISAESHSPEIFPILLGTEKYKSFKLIDGGSIVNVYKDRAITQLDGSVVQHSFPWHSAGPFGNDIDGPWLNQDELAGVLNQVGLGWKDIHASLLD